MASEVRGMAQISRRFKAFPDAVRAAVEKALDEGAAEIRDRAKAIVPTVSFELQNAIEVRNNLDGFTATGAVGNFGRMVKGSAGALRRHIGVFPDKAGAKGWYAAFVEFGTAARVTGQKYTTRGGNQRKARGRAGGAIGDAHPGTRPQPFLMPAFWTLRARVQNRIARAIGSAAKRIASGG